MADKTPANVLDVAGEHELTGLPAQFPNASASPPSMPSTKERKPRASRAKPRPAAEPIPEPGEEDASDEDAVADEFVDCEREDLLQEIARQREIIEKSQALDRKAPPRGEKRDPNAPPKWFHCGLNQLPQHMAIHVLARDEDEARRIYCERMGIVWNHTLDAPMTADTIAIAEIARPHPKKMRGKYTRAELLALSFTPRELDHAGI